ncbi:MAG: GspH/FimT family pseudopilin [Armatimonadota bacterium]|nr:GspH/FimT family pseudopilin [Armatimonadota bacterium]MDR7386122.1 GspH/FimT family pseudopilin [Armatimonadota bacterium]MDR7395902.1 GspH/FimT family pseudopilin [Armatimonadota bacterium]MDR7524815.1 GspH/FimT family pseudopilin [Armatimonadota bacterium]MDR7606459.1 GspH/FimT family pseudopilin [Armatimonadota bacterium]
MDRPSRRSRAGFTLLEALFVVAVLGILVALAFPSYQRVVMERRVQNTTREIAGLLRAAQQLAVAKSAEVGCVVVRFDEDNEVTVHAVPRDPNADAQEGCPPDGEGFSSQQILASGYTARDERSGQEWKPMRLGVTVNPQASQLAFLPSGEASPAPFTVTVSGGGHTRHVCVNAAGLVTVPPPGGQCP